MAEAYLIDDRNPTGFAQVLEEWERLNSEAATHKKSFVYGLDLISQQQASGAVHYYGYDGHGSVRFLTDGTAGSATVGQITDAYNYDAFGVLLDGWHAGTATSNDYLYAGERYDGDLGLYYLRARYLNPATGRFWSMDSYEGSQFDPASLHKYNYCHGNPVNGVDPSGHEFSLIGTSISTCTAMYMAATYNGVIAGIGNSMIFTIEGVMLGKAQNQILMDFILDETGVQTAIDLAEAGIDIANSIKDWAVGHSENEDAGTLGDLAVLHLHFETAVLPLLVNDSDYTETDLDYQDPQCFAAGTMVLTEEGLREIEKVEVGTLVWAYDVATSNRVLKPVTSTFKRQREESLEIQLNDETVQVTAEHPFFVLGKGWLRAGQLRKGDKLLPFDAENTVVVQSSGSIPGGITVYNFEVQDLHDYFITAEGSLVHNRSWLPSFHHFITKSLGSKIPYRSLLLHHKGLGTLKAVAHIDLHKALNAHLSNIVKNGADMMPRRGWSGADVRGWFTKRERLLALCDFYRNYQGGAYFQYFQEELKAMVKRGQGLDPQLFR